MKIDHQSKVGSVAGLTVAILVLLLIPSRSLIAQSQQPAQPAPEQTEPDPSDATADAAIQNAQAVDDAQAKIELLQAQVEALQASIEQIKTQMVKVTPSWKGAPQWDDKDAGFSFKPKGLIQFDAGYNGYPRGNELRGTVGGLNFNNLGWNVIKVDVLWGNACDLHGNVTGQVAKTYAASNKVGAAVKL